MLFIHTFCLFRLIKNRSFNLLCVLDLVIRWLMYHLYNHDLRGWLDIKYQSINQSTSRYQASCCRHNPNYLQLPWDLQSLCTDTLIDTSTYRNTNTYWNTLSHIDTPLTDIHWHTMRHTDTDTHMRWHTSTHTKIHWLTMTPWHALTHADILKCTNTHCSTTIHIDWHWHSDMHWHTPTY